MPHCPAPSAFRLQLNAMSTWTAAATKRAGPMKVGDKPFRFNGKPMSGMVSFLPLLCPRSFSRSCVPVGASRFRSPEPSLRQAALFACIQMCDKTDMYGFNAFLDKRKQRYHYFDDREVRSHETCFV